MPSPFRVLDLHHVTATVDEAQPDLDFCLETLSLRLVKKTVNFDNHHVYHFYYGNERGTPGTIWTTFPYHGRGLPVGQHGAGQVVATAFSVPAESLGAWQERLSAAGVKNERIEDRFGEEALRVIDPSGLVFELIATARDARAPWTGGAIAAPEVAIRGLHHVTLLVREPAATAGLMQSLLGFREVDGTDGRLRVGVGDAAPGRVIDITHQADAPSALNGLGTVHHVAMAIGSADEQLELREELVRRGIQVTPIMDRQYFRSIYFREPGGVLFEVATIQPGFLVDEELAELGRGLKLPPWEEPHREDITRGLVPVHYR